jgi:hypothetical protein
MGEVVIYCDRKSPTIEIIISRKRIKHADRCMVTISYNSRIYVCMYLCMNCMYYVGMYEEMVCKCVREGVRGSLVVKALCYKPEGRGFDSR